MKFHKLGAHLHTYITLFGRIMNGSTQSVERTHQKAAKKLWKLSSHKKSTFVNEFDKKVSFQF